MGKLPDWVLKHKTKGIAIEHRGNSYYASRVTSVWDSEKKRARRVTLEYLGRITPEGIIPPKRKNREVQIGGILEAGHMVLLHGFASNIDSALEDHFPDDWQSLLAAAAIKLCYREPFERMKLRYDTSYAKRLWPHAALSKNSLSALLERIGFEWPAQRDFFTDIAQDDKHMAIDLSHVFSGSENMPWLEIAKNGDDVWRPQLAVLLMWGTTTHRPGFLKLLPGAAQSAQVLSNALIESGLQDVTAIMDKGFYSAANVSMLEQAGIHYAMPMKRNLVEHIPQYRYCSHFLHRGSVQWWRTTKTDGRWLHQYMDKGIAAREESAYLRRVAEGKTTDARYRELADSFGTLAILTDLGLGAEKVYALYKERRDVEYAFDTLQNTLGEDVTWMRSREKMFGYHFIQFIALHLYSQVLDHLKRRKLTKGYSVPNVLAHLSKVTVIEVDGRDRLGELTKPTRTILKKLEVPITERLGL